ncbi:DMT family transporter [Sphingomonas alba]|uniref:DMT family transporter n=1 Tax=Sphingomonas alba TaxID=2908208 RepID=A0ABT0RMQ4_9SPHN|nr:DMT family transporter [Sphingomonas alba]MCL6683929.1 DMT family transporter [Sphingomonas alba]
MVEPRHPPLIAFMVAAFGIATFSAMDAVMKGLVLALGTYITLFWRSLAGMLMTGALFASSKPRRPDRRTMRIHATRGLLGSVMAATFFWGLARVPMAQAIALAFIAPLMALYLAAAILKEHVGPRLIGASIVAFAGVLIIVWGQARADLGHEALLGSIAILCSAGCYAVNIILMRQQSLAAPPVEASFFQSLFMFIGMIAAVPVLGIEPPPVDKLPLIILAAFLATTSLLLLSWAYARAQASYLATTEYTSFLWAALFGWIIFNETVSPFTVAGAAMIIGGCLLAARTPEEADPSMEVAA